MSVATPQRTERPALTWNGRLRRAVLLLVALAATTLAWSAGAAPIVPVVSGGFYPGAVVESFEGITPGSYAGGDVAQQAGLDGVYLAGTGAGGFTFASGVTLTGPNASVFNGDPFIHDFSSGSPPANGWGANGSIGSAADVPFGSAYLGIFEPVGFTAVMEFTFAAPVDQVGLYFSGSAGTTVRLDVYVGGVLVESSGDLLTGPVAGWANSFVGFEQIGIDRIVVTGQDFGIDNLTFATNPEPGTALLLGLGLVGLAARRPRR